MQAKQVMYLLAGALTLAGVGSTVQAAWIAPTGGWQVNYEASSGIRPDADTPAWGGVPKYSDGSIAGHPSDAYVVNDSVTGEKTLYLNNASTYSSYANFRSPSGGLQSDLVTLDFRFRLLDPTGRQLNVSLNRPYSDSVGGNTTITYSLGFETAAIFNFGNGQTSPVSLDNDWHDARWLLDINNKTSELFLDGSDTPFMTVAGALNKTGYNFLQFGDGSGTVAGHANVTYVRYTNAELAAVPEPASLGLLVLSGAALLHRRRRR